MPKPYHTPKGDRQEAASDQDMQSWWEGEVTKVDTDIQGMIDDLGEGEDTTPVDEGEYTHVVYQSPPLMATTRSTMATWGTDKRWW